MDELKYRYVRNLAPYPRSFPLPDGARLTLDPGINRLPAAAVEALELNPRFRQLLELGKSAPGRYGLQLVEGGAFEQLVRDVVAGKVDLNSIKYVEERIKIVGSIDSPQVLRDLLEKSKSVAVNKAIIARLKQLERY